MWENVYVAAKPQPQISDCNKQTNERASDMRHKIFIIFGFQAREIQKHLVEQSAF